MKRARQDQRTEKRRRDASAERLTRKLAAACDSPAEALELLYWSREPGLVEIIRGIAAMPEDTRGALEAFIALACDTHAVSGNLDRRGVLTLSSREATQTAALAQHAAESDTDDVPRLLN
jgi:hypothetical protein